jgi:hypothetical protein
MNGFSRAEIAAALRRVCTQFEKSKSELNELDSQLGDGDLGSTLSAISSALVPQLDTLPDDVGACFAEVAKVIAATSGSSFSAITMFGLLKVSNATNGKRTVAWNDLPDLLDAAVERMSSRGGANLGDKTVLDGLAAISHSLRRCEDDVLFPSTAKIAVRETLQKYKDEPSKIGRARIAAERSKGIDDPGMYALYLAVKAIER